MKKILELLLIITRPYVPIEEEAETIKTAGTTRVVLDYYYQ